MAVSKNDVEHIANLARLKFTDDELENFTGQMNQILKYMDKLNELDTSNVEPLSHPIENINVFREDIVRESTPTEAALKNAPSSSDTHFKVPKVINVD